MATATKMAMFPDEVFLNAAIKDRRAIKKELSLKAIGTPDTRLQQRVQTDVNHVRLLEGVLREGDKLRPIIVFEDASGKFHVADGFHRHGAHVNFGASSIWAWVIQGEWRDAMVYSTMCNRNLCLKRTKEDIKKAVMTLFGDEEWFLMADMVISKHCGVSPHTVRRYRTEYCEMHDRQTPENLRTSKGNLVPSRRTWKRGVPSFCRRTDTRSGKVSATIFFTNIDGRYIYLGTNNEEESRRRYDELIRNIENKRITLSKSSLTQYFDGQNVSIQSATPTQGTLDGVYGHRGCGCSITWCESENPDAITAAVGRVILLEAVLGATGRRVVLSYQKDKYRDTVALARQIGVEFLTPEELVASIKGDEPEAVASPA